MREDVIDITILSDGTIKVETSKISPANHMQADALTKFLEEKMGGQSTTIKRSASHVHTSQNQTIKGGK